MNAQLPLTDELIRAAMARRATSAGEGDLRERVRAATAGISQRRGWTARAGEAFSRGDRWQALVVLAAVAMLVAATLAIILVGSRDTDPVSVGRGTVFLSNGDLYVAGPTGEAARRVAVDLPGLPSRPTWVDADTVAVQSTPGGVYVVDLTTSVPRLLAEDGNLLALSPDHLRMAIGIDRPGEPVIRVVDIASGAPLADFAMATNFGQGTGIGFGPYTWSPDGRWLLGQGLRSQESARSGWIYRVDTQTGTIQDVAIDLCCGLNFANPVLSPDGSRVAFVNWRQGTGRYDTCYFRCGTIWSLELSTGARTQLTPDAGSGMWPVFSPDGSWIAFFDGDLGDAFEVAVVRPDGTGLRKLTHAADMVTHAADAFAPTWSFAAYRNLFWDADGAGITFMRGGVVGDIGDESHELWHVTLDGLVEQRLGTFFVSEFAR